MGEDLVLDAELVVPHEGRLHFGELQRRARHRGPNAIRAASERPAYLIVFDVLEAAGTELIARPRTASAARNSRTSSPAACSPPRSRCAPPPQTGQPPWTDSTPPGAPRAPW
ncbi:hypothetical protein ACIA6D_41470 [Streptomyces cacaoi]